MKNNKLILLVFTIVLSGNALQAQNEKNDDPYLWLEEVESPKSLDWVKKQNEISDKVIRSNALFKPLKEKYLEVFNDKEKVAYPNMTGNYVYNFWQDEKNERGLYRRMLKADYLNNGSNWEIVIDIDALSKKDNKKWVFEGAESLEPNNNLALVRISDGGKDENEIREFDSKSKTFVKNGFFFGESKGGASWIDQNTLLVMRNFGPGTMTTSGYPKQVKIYKRGTKLENAKTILDVPETNVGVFSSSTFYNNKSLSFVTNMIAYYNTELYFLSGEKLQKINCPKDADFLGFHKGEIIFSLQSDWNINNKNYKKGSLVSCNLDENLTGKFSLRTIYETNEKSGFDNLTFSKDFVTVNILENVQNKLTNYSFKNNLWTGEVVSAPDFGSIFPVSSDAQSNDYFFRYNNFITPSTLYYANQKDIKVIKKQKNIFDTSNLQVEQHHATSKDGTQIPYFIVHAKDMKLDGQNPTMVYAYGGFNSAMQPTYSSLIGLGWLAQGGTYVLANIRGGGEFGPSWHQGALKEKRQNAYDDFYAVSEDVIKRKITSPKHLGAFGWSNGGLMAGVLFTQRPDLYNAVCVGAPLLDMKRYSKLLAGASWMGEYGNPDVPEEWDYIKKYSPYHNLNADKKYPEVFFVTSTKDDRVHPAHARKMAAKMQDMKLPFLYHETIEGGHGAASTNEQQADIWASIYTYFNMKLKN